MFPSFQRLFVALTFTFGLFIALLAALSTRSTVQAATTTRYVATTGADVGDCSNSASPCATVQYAVDQAAAGDEIRVASGTYTGVSVRNAITQVVYISVTIILRGGYTTTDSFVTSDPNTNPTILDAQGNGRVVFITSTVGTLENLTVQNGNISGSGSGCPGAGCGGGIFATSTLTLSNVNVLSNTATLNGSGVFARSATKVNGGLFQNNINKAGLSTQGTLFLTGAQFISNTGLGVAARGAVVLNGGLFQNNGGGGLYAESTLTLTDTKFLNNTSSSSGAGVYVLGVATLNGGLFQNNAVTGFADGGGLFAYTTLWLRDTQFLSNTAYRGGGAYVYGGVATLNGSLFQNNAGTVSGSQGGGLYVRSALSLTGTQFLGNQAYQGGGLYLTNSTGHVVNALFARNSATQGAAAYFSPLAGVNVEVLHTTLASPTLASGSALYVADGAVGITNTIIASHTTGIEQTGGTVSENYNLFFGNTVTTTGSVVNGANSLTGNPAFMNPAVDDYHLTVASAAIDKGVDADILTDIDGQIRPHGAAPDLGADEYYLLDRKVYLPVVLR